MAINYRYTAGDIVKSSGTTVTINRPTGVQDNEMIAVLVGIDDTPATMTVPAGWTQGAFVSSSTGGGQLLYMLYRYASEEDPSSWNLTLAATANWVTVPIALYSSVGSTIFWNFASSGEDTTGPALVTTSHNPGIANCDVWSFFFVDETGGTAKTWTETSPAGSGNTLTEIIDWWSGDSSTLTLSVNREQQTTNAATTHASTHTGTRGGPFVIFSVWEEAHFGRTQVGQTWYQVPANTKIATKHVVPTGFGSIPTGTARLRNTLGGAAADVRMEVYADSSGVPGAKLGQSNDTTLAAGAAAQSKSFTFGTPAAVTGGSTVWLVLHVGSQGTIEVAYDAHTSVSQQNGDTWSDGGADPFGTPTAGDKNMTIGAWVAGGLTRVTATRALQWKITGKVSATRQLKWGVAGRITASRQVLWNVTGSVVTTMMAPLYVGMSFGNEPYDTTPTYTDVTQYVISWGFERGRRTLTDAIDPAKLTIVMRSDNRQFDPSYTGSPFYPNVKLGTRIVVQIAGHGAYSGFVDEYDQQWDKNGNDHRVVITASDVFDTFNVDMIPATVYSVQKSGARITAGLVEIGVPSSWYTGVQTGVDDIQAHTAGDEDNWLTHMKNVAQTEQGYLFQDRVGMIKYYQRHSLSLAPFTTIQATISTDPISGEWPVSDVTNPTWSIRDVANDVRVSRQGGATSRVFDSASIAEYRKRTFSLSTLHNDVNTPTDLAGWILNMRKNPSLRPDGVLLEPQQAAGMYDAIIPRELADRIRLKVRPLMAPGDMIDLEYTIQSIKMSMGEDRRLKVEWNLSPPPGAAQIWLLGTHTLGINTYLGF